MLINHLLVVFGTKVLPGGTKVLHAMQEVGACTWTKDTGLRFLLLSMAQPPFWGFSHLAKIQCLQMGYSASLGWVGRHFPWRINVGGLDRQFKV